MLLIVLIFVIIVITIWCKQGDSLEHYAKLALDQLFSCTLQQAEDFDVAVIQSAAEEIADYEIGLTQKSDEKLKDYLIKRFGNSMTNACMEELAMNRDIYKSVALAESLNTDIKAGKIELTKCSVQQECYNFSVEIRTSVGDKVATAWGTISMEKDGAKWKASKITLMIEEIHN